MIRQVALSLVTLTFACGVESSTGSADALSGSSELEQTFERAAAMYQVPAGVLKSVAWVETRFSPTVLESASGGWGLMQLPTRPDWNQLEEGARLTGLEVGRLKVDAHANVVAAAAVLRALFDRTAQGNASLDARSIGDWYPAVALYPGFDSPMQANEYATEVFTRLEQGFEVVHGVRLAPTASEWRVHAPASQARRDGLGDYPGAAFIQSPNYTSGRSSYDFILIHTMQGSYAGSKSWFLSTASKVSAHYLVRSSDGEITQMVSDSDTAWHAQCYNSRAIGIEHEGYISDPSTWYTTAMYTESAKLTRYLADRHSIPRDRTHIIGHNEVASSCNTNNHTDPGSGWNWTKYMQLVNGGSTTQTNGVLLGVVYTGGDTNNRQSGATVSAGGQSVTTGSDGSFQFTLAPGAYTLTVTKSGFSQVSTSRTVTAGAQTWASTEITPTTSSSQLTGVVYVYNATSPADHSVPVSDAMVSVNGATQTTTATGSFSFSLAAGTYTVSVSKTGYRPNQRTVIIGTGTTNADVGLTLASAPDTQKPLIALVSPKSGLTLDFGYVELSGTVTDDSGPVGTVALSLNGSAPKPVAVSGGVFSTQAILAPGSNTLTFSAIDPSGNVGSLSATLSFNAGVAGIVAVAGGKPLARATVQLRDGATRTLVASALTDEAGEYFVPATKVPADYVLVVKLSGYHTSSQTVTVPQDQKLIVDVPLTPGDDSNQAIEVTFAEPLDGATVTTDTVSVYGSVQGFDVAQVMVNGITADLLGAGGFSATVTLTPGVNTIEAVATGLSDQTVTATMTLYRRDVAKMVSAKSGCSATGVEWVWVLAALPFFVTRRRFS